MKEEEREREIRDMIESGEIGWFKGMCMLSHKRIDIDISEMNEKIKSIFKCVKKISINGITINKR